MEKDQNASIHNTHKTIEQLRMQLDEMNEMNFDERVLDQYLSAIAEEPEQQCAINVQNAFEKFQRKHKVLMDSMRTDCETLKNKPTHRAHRWGYRLLVIAAAVVVLNALLTVALGSSPVKLIAQWGDQSFRFHQSDFQTSEDGNIIYYPDGSAEDVGGLDGATADSALNRVVTEGMQQVIGMDGLTYYVDSENREHTIGLNGQEFTSAPLGEPGAPDNPYPVDTTPMTDDPDTDVSALGLEKGSSQWDESHSLETFRILNTDIVGTAKAYGIGAKLFPTQFPDGFTQDYIEVQRDHLLNETNFYAVYTNPTSGKTIDVNSSTVHEGYDGATYYKDDRPVENHTAGGVDYYIMHLHETLTAVAHVGNLEIFINGEVTVDEMKKIIDSVYEGE